jgi:hypothetical protein
MNSKAQDIHADHSVCVKKCAPRICWSQPTHSPNVSVIVNVAAADRGWAGKKNTENATSHSALDACPAGMQ